MVKNINLKTNKGFTLVELMIVVGLLGISLTLTTGILLSVVKTARKQEILRNIERNGEAVIRQIEDNVRKANSVTSDSNNNLVVQIPTRDGTIVTRYFGWVQDPSPCENNYVFMTEGSLSGNAKLSNRLVNSTGDHLAVTDFTFEVYDTDRPTQLFVKLTLQSCYDSSIEKSFQTFITARGTYY